MSYTISHTRHTITQDGTHLLWNVSRKSRVLPCTCSTISSSFHPFVDSGMPILYMKMFKLCKSSLVSDWSQQLLANWWQNTTKKCRLCWQQRKFLLVFCMGAVSRYQCHPIPTAVFLAVSPASVGAMPFPQPDPIPSQSSLPAHWHRNYDQFLPLFPLNLTFCVWL